MTFEEFMEAVVEAVEEKFEGHTIKISKVAKNNTELDGISVIAPGSNIGPTFYVQPMYEAYKNGKSFEEIFESVTANIKQSLENASHFSVENILANAEDKVVFELINAEANKDFLANAPHRMWNDLAIIYRVLIGNVDNGTASCKVTNAIANQLELSEADLYSLAEANTKRMLPPVVTSMVDTLIEMGMPEELAGQMREENPMYVISNSEKHHGASSIILPGVLSRLADDIGDDLYILPSSIHEVLAIPCTFSDTETLLNMVQEVNASEVAVEERLANQVYIYSRAEDKVTAFTDNALSIAG